MPYKSLAQAAYFNIHKKELEKEGVDVAEWNKASKGKKFPKKIKSYKDGGTVPKTGIYKLHEGETVIPASQSMDKSSMEIAASALRNAAKKPAQKAKLRMTIKPTDNDRFVVDHDSMGSEGMGQPPMQHSINDVDELVAHVKKTYGAKAKVPEAAPAQ